MPPIFTNDQVINQIDSGYYWQTGPYVGDPIATSVTYGIPTSSDWVSAAYGEGAGWSQLNSTQAASANMGFELWDDLIALDLNPASDPNDADIRISNTTTSISSSVNPRCASRPRSYRPVLVTLPPILLESVAALIQVPVPDVPGDTFTTRSSIRPERPQIELHVLPRTEVLIGVTPGVQRQCLYVAPGLPVLGGRVATGFLDQ